MFSDQLQIVSSGVIKGGKIDYWISDDGNIGWAGNIKIKLGFISKTYDFSGHDFVTPQLTSWATYATHMDEPLIVDDVRVQTMAVYPDASALVRIASSKQDISALMSIRQTAEGLIAIISAKASASVKGMHLTVEARK